MNVFTSARPPPRAAVILQEDVGPAEFLRRSVGFQDLPQNSVNHLSTMALLS